MEPTLFHRPAVSVVMSTYNRAALLPAAIQSLMQQAAGGPAYEVVLVDNNSSDQTASIVVGLVAQYAPRLRSVFEGKQGVCHGRNAGIAAATAPIIAFTDDDVRVAPDWIAAIVRAMAAHPDAAYVGGKVLPAWPTPPPTWLTDRHWAPLALTDLGEAVITVSAQYPLCLVAASLAVRREVFAHVGGFDPAFSHAKGAVSSVDDHDFQLRLWRAGLTGRYVPEIVVTADVQAERLTKRYHRQWHSDHGAIFPYLHQPQEWYDAQGALASMPLTARRVAGVPPWLLRELARGVGRCAMATLRGATHDAFAAELCVREQWGVVRACVKRRALVAAHG